MFAVEIIFSNGHKLEFQCKAYDQEGGKHGKDQAPDFKIGKYVFYGMKDRVIPLPGFKELIPAYIKTSLLERP